MKTTLLIRHHMVSPSDPEPDDLFRLLLQISNYHLETRPLVTGRSGNVTGEVLLSSLQVPSRANFDLTSRFVSTVASLFVQTKPR